MCKATCVQEVQSAQLTVMELCTAIGCFMGMFAGSQAGGHAGGEN